MNKRRKIVFTTALIVVVPALFFLVLGCVKAPAKKVDYGSEVSQEDINAAINDAIPASYDLTLIDEGQFIQTRKTEDVRGGYLRTMLDDATTIVKRTATSDPDVFIYEYIAQFIEYGADGTPYPYDKSGAVPIGKPTATASSYAATEQRVQTAQAQFSDLRQDLFKAQKVEPKSADKITRHNLKVTRTTMPAPPSIKKFEDCQGLANCELRIVILSWDQVEWTGDTSTKLNVKWVVSPDLAYLRFGKRYDADAGAEVEKIFFDFTVQQCLQMLVPVEDQKVLVNYCSDLKDFQFHK